MVHPHSQSTSVWSLARSLVVLPQLARLDEGTIKLRKTTGFQTFSFTHRGLTSALNIYIYLCSPCFVYCALRLELSTIDHRSPRVLEHQDSAFVAYLFDLSTCAPCVQSLDYLFKLEYLCTMFSEFWITCAVVRST